MARGGQDGFIEAVEVEVFRDHEVLREGNQHALESLKVIQCRCRQGYHRRRNRLTGSAHQDITGGDFGHTIEFGNEANQAHVVTNRHIHASRRKDEHAVRGGRVTVSHRILNVEAVQIPAVWAGVVLEVANHHALNHHHRTGQRADITRSLDFIDGGVRILAKANFQRRQNIHFVWRAWGIICFTHNRCTREARDAGQIKVVAHPIRGRVGIKAVRNARSAARGKGHAVVAHAEHRHAVGYITGATVVHRHSVDHRLPGHAVEYAVVIGVQIIARSAGEVLHHQQRDRAVF